MASSHATKTGNPLLDYPGWSATLFAIITLAGFLFFIYAAAVDANAHAKQGAGGHGAGHGAGASAPAGHH